MAYTLEQLSADIREALKAHSGIAGKQAVCKLVSKVLLDQEFIAKHLTAEQCHPRKVLYEDPELGFCVCGHVYENAAHGLFVTHADQLNADLLAFAGEHRSRAPATASA